jgi:hypothetical protein
MRSCPPRQEARAVVEPELLHEALGLSDELLERLLALLGRRELEHLDLVELVPADRSALLGAVAPALAPVAGRVRERLDRQRFPREDLVAVHVEDRGLGRRQEEVLPIARALADVEHVVDELRELARRVAALLDEEMRRQENV